MKKVFFLLLLILLLSLVGASSSPAKESRIINGSPTSIKKWPFLTPLVLRADPNPYRGFICGGSLIKKRIILTAAHCVYKTPPSDYDILFRKNNLISKKGQRVPIMRIKVHPLYNEDTLQNDLALLRIKAPLPGRYGVLGPLPGENSFLNTAGWGWDGRGYSKILLEAKAQKIDNKKCSDIYSNLSDDMFCAEGKGREPCTNDSGGPLVERSGNQFIIRGIVSWGDIDCANSPTVYATIDIPWIKRVVARWQKRSY